MKRSSTPLQNFSPFFDPSAIEVGTGGQIDWDKVTSGKFIKDAKPIEITANASANATTVAVVALPLPLSKGQVLKFGDKKFVQLSADALEGAESLTVEALGVAVADGDIAWVSASGSTDKMLPQATVVVRDATSGKFFPRADIGGGSEKSCGLLVQEAYQNSDSHSTIYVEAIGATVYENLLPDADADGVLSSTWKTELRETTRGISFTKLVDGRVD